MYPWTVPWGMPWGMPIVWALVGIALFAMTGTGVLFSGAIWYAINNLNIQVRKGNSENQRIRPRTYR